MHWLSRTDYRSFILLNATQFLGALNDNIFKLLVIYLLINVEGPAAAGTVLSMAGGVFVVPFLLFSSSAGVLADRISKRTITVYTKILEVLIMLFGLLAVYFESPFGSYTALFFMATQSAIFGPSKYGIIPELVEPKMVSKANGSLTSFTYLAIILGTFLASFLTDITNKNFVLEASFCVLIAVLGLLTSLGIKKTEPQNSTKKINPFFFYEIYQNLKLSWSVPHLIPTIFGSAYFLFIGAFTQLNIIPFAMQSLHLSEVGGGYLFLPTAVGIAIGALLAGKLSKDRVELGLSCLTGFFISFVFLILYLFSWSLTMTLITLALLGILGGMYLVPFDSFIQINSPDEKRGQIIAAANFLSFVGVLMASFFLYFISEELHLTAASGFAFISVLTLIVNIITVGRLSALFFPFFAQKIVKSVRTLTLASPQPSPDQLIVYHSRSWLDAVLLFAHFPKLNIIVPANPFQQFPWINGLVESIWIVPPLPESRASLQKSFEKAKKLQEEKIPLCLFFHGEKVNEEIVETYRSIFSRLGYQFVFAHGKKEKLPMRFVFRYYLKKITMTFSKDIRKHK
ncbi:MAG TPA: MFS transporter [Parachlamydiales bacterium]|nr:MFS transporter [Parachlamydiales bacterium]